jgi:hypothetical protein
MIALVPQKHDNSTFALHIQIYYHHARVNPVIIQRKYDNPCILTSAFDLAI